MLTGRVSMSCCSARVLAQLVREPLRSEIRLYQTRRLSTRTAATVAAAAESDKVYEPRESQRISRPARPTRPTRPTRPARPGRTAMDLTQTAAPTDHSRSPRKESTRLTRPSPSLPPTISSKSKTPSPAPQRETWQVQKAALAAKFGDQGWAPRKRISPDALQGIRALHDSQPEIYTTETLSAHFKISPEAVRRILKSKWRPNEGEQEDRRRRWERRGEGKWGDMVAQGVRPPKKWRDMGVGRVTDAEGRTEPPLWKRRNDEKIGTRPQRGERWIDTPDSEMFARVADAMADAEADPGSHAKAPKLPSLADRIS